MSEHDLSLKTARPWTLRPANDNGTRPGQNGPTNGRRRRGHGTRPRTKAIAHMATPGAFTRHLSWLSFSHPENGEDERDEAAPPVFAARPDEALR